jgi:hypothetical protein
MLFSFDLAYAFFLPDRIDMAIGMLLLEPYKRKIEHKLFIIRF